MSLGPDARGTSERRGNRAPIPANPGSTLSQEQSLALCNVENFGRHLAFIRQPVFEDHVAAVISPDRRRVAVLETDGQVNMQPDIVLRSQPYVQMTG